MEILQKKLIVVAASEPSSRDGIREEFEKAGSTVLSATGGFEAYELVRARNVDAVVVGGRLSSGSPAVLLSDVRRLSHDLPVVLFGAAGEAMTQTEALHRGFAAYFLQTFPALPILQAVARSLEFVEERKRRKVERVAVAAQAEIRLSAASMNMKLPVLNLSRGGMFLSLERNFPPVQSEVEFSVVLLPPDSDAVIKGKALVRWVREREASGHLPGIGLEFIELDDSAKGFLDAYIAKQKK